MHCRLTKFLLNNSVINNYLHGFQSKKSTTTYLADLLDSITSLLDKKFTLSLFIDVSKVYDSIEHEILFNKLNYYSVSGIALQWFHNYLSNRFMYTEINGVHSERCFNQM